MLLAYLQIYSRGSSVMGLGAEGESDAEIEEYVDIPSAR